MKFTAMDILFMIFVGPIPPSFLKTPPPKEEKPKDFEVPIVENGTGMPYLWGKRPINPIVVEYGDVETYKKKVDAGGKK